MSSPAPPLLLPRGLIFVASIWLIASWLIAIGLKPPVQPSSASYTPGVRLMLLCVAVGLTIGWPLLRLSQDQPTYWLRQTLLDVGVLLGLIQVVVWPLRLVTTWSPARTAAIDATLAGWSLLAGALVAAALSTPGRGSRMLAMAACVGLCLLAPLVAWSCAIAGLDAPTVAHLSPLLAVRELGEGGSLPPTPAQWRSIGFLAAADLAAWCALFAIAAMQQRPVSDAPGIS